MQTVSIPPGCSQSHPVLQLKHCSGRWNQSALHWSHMPEGRKRHVLAVAVIHQLRQAFSPQTQCYLRWQSAVELTISIPRPATVSGHWLHIRFSPFAVLCQPVRGGRVRDVLLPQEDEADTLPCNSDVKDSLHIWYKHTTTVLTTLKLRKLH